ncbi:MAG: SDR family oxidoreductase [Leptospirales bacterium]|nr:SDR family oxidoreductase [Leptospirales bacterium]
MSSDLELVQSQGTDVSLTFLVTGGNAGIGKATVEGLAKIGARVIVGGRSEEKTKAVIAEISARYKNAELHFFKLDLADLKSVKNSVEGLLASGLFSSRPLDVLINNAGLAGASGLTADGFELTIGTNHLGPYYLTKLLLPEISRAKQGRIVNVASGAHLRVTKIDWDLLRESAANTAAALNRYGISKLMNVLHAKELARQLAGTSTTTYSLHPGVVASEIWREVPIIIRWPLKLFMVSNEEGAKTSLYCATDPGLSNASGRYYDNMRETACNPLAEDQDLARRLFEWSDEAISKSV